MSRLGGLDLLRQRLSDVYTPEGVEVWLHARNRELDGQRPLDLLVAGEYERVLAAVERLRERSGVVTERLSSDLIRPYDSDHTALVHVLWEAGIKGAEADALASRIMQSKWMHAVRQHACEGDVVRGRYWQALIDIAGLENWEDREMGQIARDALREETPR